MTQPDEILAGYHEAKLRAENAKLREALKKIAEGKSVLDAQTIARMALKK